MRDPRPVLRGRSGRVAIRSLRQCRHHPARNHATPRVGLCLVQSSLRWQRFRLFGSDRQKRLLGLRPDSGDARLSRDTETTGGPRRFGGGETIEDAIADARESCPLNTSWHPPRWNDLYRE